MAARLGNVLYWLGCAIAGLIVAGTAAGLYFSPHIKAADQWYLASMAGGFALVIWLTGRAAKYVFSGN